MNLRCIITLGTLLACPGFALGQQAGLVQAFDGDYPEDSGEGGQDYLVQSHDTFAALSERLGVTEDALAAANGGRRVALVDRYVQLPPRLVSLGGPDLGDLLARIKRGESFSERGAGAAPRSLARDLARRPDGRKLLPGESGTPFAERLDWDPFPLRGEQPRGFAPWTLDFLDAEVTQACVAVSREGREGLQVRWHGRDALSNVGWGGAAYPIPALLTVSALNRFAPGASLPDLRIRGLGEARDREIPVRDFLVAMAAERDGARAASLARFLPREARESWSVGQTGHPHQLRGDFAEPLFAPPGLIDGHEAVLRGRLDQGSPGANLLSAYDLVRLLAMATWHPFLDRDQRLAATKGDGLVLVLESMAHDRARYLDVALDELGLRGQLGHLAVVSASGWERLADGRFRLTYVAALQADDRRRDPAVQRRFVLALAVEHPTPEWAEARLTHQVVELTRWLFSGELR